MTNLTAIHPLCDLARQRSTNLAQQLNLPLLEELDEKALSRLSVILDVDPEQSYLRLAEWSQRTRMGVDFTRGKLGYRKARLSAQNELLARATAADQARGMTLVDATAGFGTDSLMLAALGFRVTGLERHPLLAYLLQEALERAAEQGEPLAGNLEFLHRDACGWLAQQEAQTLDLCYLDPMFPERTKSAQVKKPMQLLQRMLEGDPEDEVELLNQALRATRYRVVVKRPLRAPVIGDRKPDVQLRGKTIRFDIYALSSLRSN